MAQGPDGQPVTVPGNADNPAAAMANAVWGMREAVALSSAALRKAEEWAKGEYPAKAGTLTMADNEGEIQDKTVVQKLFDEVAPRYANRAGGYTRIIHLADRRIGDAGSQVLLQLVEETPAEAVAAPATSSRRNRRGDKRRKMAAGQKAAETAVADAPAAEAPAAEGEQAKE